MYYYDNEISIVDIIDKIEGEVPPIIEKEKFNQQINGFECFQMFNTSMIH